MMSHNQTPASFGWTGIILIREGRKVPAGDDMAPFNHTEPVQTVFMNPEVLVPDTGDQRFETLERFGLADIL